MGERDQIGRTFGSLDAGDARHAQHVPFLGYACRDLIECCATHADAAACNSDPVSFRFASDIHHVRVAARVEVRERFGGARLSELEQAWAEDCLRYVVTSDPMKMESPEPYKAAGIIAFMKAVLRSVVATLLMVSTVAAQDAARSGRCGAGRRDAAR